ncbi:hypothetical protein AVO42_02765 [Thiomicrospira sp. XS5]|uniref:phytanoyl-CoA dioxygenase family protein n=1 Tax=Thiomicrospira sp. XS5 TaxID=1775636 RepID=UPI000749DA57|nr:phytanoyl-CoA dioxygenase family protein [Thiomicrospira sp. XS5]KUJ74350.1 hypothetical protein AVO42_02765 [Thiomicrospira sp. XS5]
MIGSRDDFESDGFCLIRKCFPVEKILAVRRAWDEFLAEWSPHDFVESGANRQDFVVLGDLDASRTPGISLTPSERDELFILGDLHRYFPHAFDVIGLSALQALTADLLECSIGELVYDFSNLTRKALRIGPNMNWHRDMGNRYISSQNGDAFLRVLIPLDVSREENGTLGVFPGSHRRTTSLPVRSELEALGAPFWLDMAPGDAVWIHPMLLHGGGPNRSENDRNFLIVQLSRRGADSPLNLADATSGQSFSDIIHRVLTRPGAFKKTSRLP